MVPSASKGRRGRQQGLRTASLGSFLLLLFFWFERDLSPHCGAQGRPAFQVTHTLVVQTVCHTPRLRKCSGPPEDKHERVKALRAEDHGRLGLVSAKLSRAERARKLPSSLKQPLRTRESSWTVSTSFNARSPDCSCPGECQRFVDLDTGRSHESPKADDQIAEVFFQHTEVGPVAQGGCLLGHLASAPHSRETATMPAIDAPGHMVPLGCTESAQFRVNCTETARSRPDVAWRQYESPKGRGRRKGVKHSGKRCFGPAERPVARKRKLFPGRRKKRPDEASCAGRTVAQDLRR